MLRHATRYSSVRCLFHTHTLDGECPKSATSVYVCLCVANVKVCP